jgi:hypothetical protein
MRKKRPVVSKVASTPLKSRAWSFQEIDSNVHVLRFERMKANTEYRILWLADLHWDNPKCDRGMLKRHMDEALEHDAPIVVVGDLFCAMQGKYDRRSNKSDVRPEHQSGDYLDKLVDTAAEWFKPYSQHLVLIGQGNHESSIRERHETCLLDRLAYKLRADGGLTRTGGYDGWLRVRLDSNGHKDSWVGYYHHGAGGGGPVTKGIIDFNRLTEQVVADFFVMGHVHRSMTVENVVRKLNDVNRVEIVERDYVRLSTYKEEASSGHGFATERMMGSRPLGGKWLIIRSHYEGKRVVYARRWVRV